MMGIIIIISTILFFFWTAFYGWACGEPASTPQKHFMTRSLLVRCCYIFFFCILLQPILILSTFYLYTSSPLVLLAKCDYFFLSSALCWPLHFWTNEWQYGNMLNDRCVSFSRSISFHPVEHHDTKNRLVFVHKAARDSLKMHLTVWCLPFQSFSCSVCGHCRAFLVMLFLLG